MTAIGHARIVPEPEGSQGSPAVTADDAVTFQRKGFLCGMGRRCHRWRARICLGCLLTLWTALRIGLNVVHITYPTDATKLLHGDELPILWQLLFGIVGPVISAVSLLYFLLKIDISPTCQVGRIPMLVTSSCTACFFVVFLSLFLEMASGAVPFVRIGNRSGLFFVAMFQARELGRENVAHRGGLLTIAIVAGFGLAALFEESETPPLLGLVFSICAWICWAVFSLFFAGILLWEWHLKSQMFQHKKSKDERFTRSVARTLWLLQLSAYLTIIDGFYLPLTLVFDEGIVSTGISRYMIYTIDTWIVVLSIFVKSGLFGPKETLDQLQVLAELQYMALTHGRRIAFHGRVNLESEDCIVSFPGKYAEEWDDVVKIALTRTGAPSLACVFLTDEASGLGKHADNPERPGQCWCEALYGKFGSEVYVSIFENPGELTEEELLFKETDARAMGQIFLKRQSGQSDQQWEKDKEEARKQAAEKCEQNGGLAPWGCYWFHQWLKQVEEAKGHNQTFHVFYFEDAVGRGKLRWEDLSNEASVKKARQDGGLGRSQMAEVAYLQRKDYDFEEHDVKDFYRFMNSHSND